MFNAGEKIHYFGEEVGIINGTYVGKFIGSLHHFKDVSGNLCAGRISEMGQGHHKFGKKKWG